MLWCETGGEAPHDFEDLAVVVSQLDALGLPACVDLRSVPAGLSRNAQFDLAPFLRDGPPGPGDRVLLVAAQRMSDRKLADLRRLGGAEPRASFAFGGFENRQALIGAKAKLSYVLSQDPEIVDLKAAGVPGRDCPVFGVPRAAPPSARPRLLIVGPDLQDSRQAAALVALALSPRFRTAVLTDGKLKHDWIAAHGPGVAFYHFGELLPATLAERVDIFASFRPLQRNHRLQSLVANLAVSGAALLDGSAGHAVAQAHDAFIRAPIDLLGLAAFLDSEITPNLAAIADQVRASATAARFSGAALAARLGTAPAAAPPRAEGRVVFLPTNGVGLGHAQRCTLIAAGLDPARPAPAFAVFPSCMGLVKAYGHDATPLVSRSSLHAQSHENDLANYLRLRALAAPADTLVFDGGYVFDSVYRTILERRLQGVWIRRGLWQAGQDNTTALDREKAFARVIVPGEAFAELNVPYSHGEQVRAVGPIVQRIALDPSRRAELRAELARRFGLEFERLIVTQLGAGVAADRAAQIQALCGMMERRSDALHLVVLWPTATLQPSWFGWRRSRVVKTHRAGVLAAAADLLITAAGYNSFHEVLYNALPAIFLPQTGAFMDDQKARARAARDRGLAGLVEPQELMTLEREIARRLDPQEAAEARRRLAALDLPEPGNARAAALIEELTHGHASLDRASRADRPAGRR
jgi:hypothetical protein